MAYTRLIVLVMAFEVLISVVVGLGIYVGFAVFPYSQSLGATGDTMGSAGIHATIPLYMPSLSDLKMPYTSLQAGSLPWGITAFLVSAVLITVQSFVRGMYLGGLKAWGQSRKQVALIACGRRYFRDMLAWSIFQNVVGLMTLFFAVAFFPLGILVTLVMMFYAITPYLIVLQDLTFSEAIAKAPRLFRRYFSTMLPLALLALFCTFFISLFRSLTPPLGYAVTLFAYACVGTLLISELMLRLSMRLKSDGKQVSQLPFEEVRSSRTVNTLIALLVPVLLVSGIFASYGRHLSAFEFGRKSELDGISYNTNFSDVYYASQHTYTSYEWQSQDYKIEIGIPDLSNEKPNEIRGIAKITWELKEETRITNGNSTVIDVKPVMQESKLMYRLVKETANNGSIYYSSLNGSSSILPGGERLREPMSIQMIISGNGKHIFVMQYPSRFDYAKVFRVSDDGQFLISGTSQINPVDFHYYWFTQEQKADHVFEILAAKNTTNYLSSMNRAYIGIASALQEGDGQMVVKLLDTIRKTGVNVKAPNWDVATWTDNLRGRYAGASMQTTLELLTKAGVQGGYESKELSEQSDEKTRVGRVEVKFPDSILPITFKESKVDGKLLSIEVMVD